MSIIKEKLNNRRGRKRAEEQLLARKYIEEVANEWSGGDGYRSMLSKEVAAYRFMLETKLDEMNQRLYSVENAVAAFHEAANDLERLRDQVADEAGVDSVSFPSFQRAFDKSVQVVEAESAAV